jgi:L-lactate permease
VRAYTGRVKSIPPVVYYTVLRLLTFAVPLTALLLVGIEPWIATILAALIGLSFSYIFLQRPREAVSRDLYERRHGTKKIAEDENAEDAVSDAAAPDTVPRAER